MTVMFKRKRQKQNHKVYVVDCYAQKEVVTEILKRIPKDVRRYESVKLNSIDPLLWETYRVRIESLINPEERGIKCDHVTWMYW